MYSGNSDRTLTILMINDAVLCLHFFKIQPWFTNLHFICRFLDISEEKGGKSTSSIPLITKF